MNAVSITQIPVNVSSRYRTHILGLDSLLGGGFMAGSAVLFAGEPGVGKSTLFLQVSEALAKENRTVLYASGEENLSQIKQRADRLQTLNPRILCSETINLEELNQTILETNPQVIVVDSLQMLFSRAIKPAPGTPSQMRYCLASLIELVKRTNKILIVIGHSTKSGLIAGLLTLQHMVDVVLFMRNLGGDLREVESKKNRFGPALQKWIVLMASTGLLDSTKIAEVFKLEYSQIREILDKHLINKIVVGSDMKWLLEQALGKKALTNMLEYDIVFKLGKSQTE